MIVHDTAPSRQMLAIAKGFGLSRADVIANKDALEKFMANLPSFEELLEKLAEEEGSDLEMHPITHGAGSAGSVASSRLTEDRPKPRKRRARFADDKPRKGSQQSDKDARRARVGWEDGGGGGDGASSVDSGSAWSESRPTTVVSYKLGPDGLPLSTPHPDSAPAHLRISLPLPIGVNKFGAHIFALDVETRNGWTALTRAAISDNNEAMRTFVALGAQIDLETRLRHTALTYNQHMHTHIGCVCYAMLTPRVCSSAPTAGRPRVATA